MNRLQCNGRRKALGLKTDERERESESESEEKGTFRPGHWATRKQNVKEMNNEFSLR